MALKHLLLTTSHVLTLMVVYAVWMCQEHWLSESQIPLMQNLGCQFFARSGMEEAISSGIYRRRPFGGVGIAWSSNLDQV